MSVYVIVIFIPQMWIVNLWDFIKQVTKKIQNYLSWLIGNEATTWPMSPEPKIRGHQLLQQFKGFLDQNITSNANPQFWSPIFSSITFIKVGMIFLSSIITLSNEKNVQAMNMRMKWSQQIFHKFFSKLQICIHLSRFIVM